MNSRMNIKLAMPMASPRMLSSVYPGLCPEPDTLILTHCAGGGRASLVAARLQEMGYTNVYAITAKYEDIKAVFG